MRKLCKNSYIQLSYAGCSALMGRVYMMLRSVLGSFLLFVSLQIMTQNTVVDDEDSLANSNVIACSGMAMQLAVNSPWLSIQMPRAIFAYLDRYNVIDLRQFFFQVKSRSC
jgi:hypothetical protein